MVSLPDIVRELLLQYAHRSNTNVYIAMKPTGTTIISGIHTLFDKIVRHECRLLRNYGVAGIHIVTP